MCVGLHLACRGGSSAKEMWQQLGRTLPSIAGELGCDENLIPSRYWILTWGSRWYSGCTSLQAPQGSVVAGRLPEGNERQKAGGLCFATWLQEGVTIRWN